MGRAAPLLLCLMAALALASPAEATITVGSDLTEAASSQASDCSPLAPTCTSMLARAKPGNLYPAASPADGTVVRFGIKSGDAETVTFHLLHLDADIAAKVLLVGGASTGPTVTLPGPGTFEFPASVPIKAGDSVGFDSSSSTAYGACQSGAELWKFSPPLVDGASFQPPQSSQDCELLVDAVVEPSASVGFGRGAVSRAGRTRLVLHLPGPGTLTLSGTQIRTVRRNIARAGTFNAPVHLRGDARRRITKSGHARVGVSETFTPTGGVAGVESLIVNFKGGTR